MKLSRITYVVIISLLMYGIPPQSATGADDGPIIETIIVGAEYYASLIRDIKVAYTLRCEYAPVYGIEDYIVKATWIAKDAKEFWIRKSYKTKAIGENQQDPFHINILAFDGEKSVVYHPLNYDKKGTARIAAGKEPSFGMYFKPEKLMGSIQHGVPLYETLRNYSPIVEKERADVNGRKCYVVEATFPVGRPGHTLDYRVKFWIDTERSFLPLRIEMYEAKNSRLAFIYDSIKLREIQEGIWFPVQGTRRGRDTRAVPEIKGDVGKEVLVVDSVEINTGFDDSVFKITFPPGCSVLDETIALGYFIPSLPSDKEINGLVGKLPLDLERNQEITARRATPRQEGRMSNQTDFTEKGTEKNHIHSTKLVLTILVAAMFLIAAAIVFALKKRGTLTPETDGDDLHGRNQHMSVTPRSIQWHEGKRI